MKRLFIVVVLSLPFLVHGQQIEKLQKQVAKGNVRAMNELAACYEAGFGVDVDSSLAFSLYQQAALKGDAEAKGCLSLYYLDRGDTLQAIALAQEAYKLGSPYYLGAMYYRGYGVAKDIDRARSLFDEAIKKNHPSALSYVARAYYFGYEGFPHNVPLAVQLAKKINDGYWAGEKYYILARYNVAIGNAKEAWKWIEKGKSWGNMEAEETAASFHLNGTGCEKSEELAFKEYEALIQKYPTNYYVVANYVIAQLYLSDRYANKAKALQMLKNTDNYYLLGDQYYFGYLSDPDTQMAVHYWRLGAEKKDGEAAMNLALYLLDNNQLDSARYYINQAYSLSTSRAADFLAREAVDDENYNQALMYWKKQADWGDEEGRIMEGRYYLFQERPDDAYNCFRTAADNLYSDAWFWMASTTTDDKKAMKLVNEGLKYNCASCAIALAEFQLQQDEPNYDKAALYYAMAHNEEGDMSLAKLYINEYAYDLDSVRKAMELFKQYAQTNGEAMYYLARIYSSDVLGEPNVDSSFYWYSRMADMGIPLGYLSLGIAYESGQGVEADTLKAIEYYEKAGEGGFAKGYAYCADFYFHGTGVPQDYAKAFEYDLKGSLCLYEPEVAKLRLASCYLSGYGTDIDTATAIQLLKESAQAGSYNAAAILADFYYDGLGGLPQNSDSAYAYYYQASQGDVPRADYMMGRLFYQSGSYGPALQYLASATRNGSVDAYELMGEALYFGNGIDENYEQAYTVFSQAAQYGNSAAYVMLGVMHLYGDGCTADTLLAFRYMDTAANMGNPIAMRNLSTFYLEGMGVAVDTAKAISYLLQSAEAGNNAAALRLGIAYASGEGVSHDRNQAVTWYRIAADGGNSEAMWRLGLCYEDGEGVILSHRKAYEMYMRSAESGSPIGMYLVARCYEDSIFVEHNMVEAANWYRRAAEQGHAPSCYILGTMYAEGKGVKRNKKEAKKWLTIASLHGLEAASLMLEEL